MDQEIAFLGGCLCGAVRIKVIGEPLFTQYCHCNKCREVALLSERDLDRRGYSFTAAYLTKNVHITQGEETLELLQKNASVLYCCSHCHSLIYGISQDKEKQGGIGININNLEFLKAMPNTFQPDKHIYYSDRTVDFSDALPKYIDAPKEQFGSGRLYIKE